MNSSRNLMDILRSASSFLQEKGIENPRGNAEWLLGKALNLSRVELFMQYDRPLKDDELEIFREYVRRRVRHEPLQQILGTVEFCGITIETPQGVFIPRPETEEMVEWLIAEIRKIYGNQPVHMLDIGTGSGCISVASAAALPNLKVDAVDFSFDALQCTNSNAKRNHVQERVRVLQADVFSERFISSINPPYEIVVSNPPYIAESDFEGLAPEVRIHDPKSALVAEDNGLAFYRKFAEFLPTLLNSNGLFAVEIGLGQAETVCELYEKHLDSTKTIPDLSGIPRIVTGTKRAEHD